MAFVLRLEVLVNFCNFDTFVRLVHFSDNILSELSYRWLYMIPSVILSSIS